jgi:WD40 repeat protein
MRIPTRVACLTSLALIAPRAGAQTARSAMAPSLFAPGIVSTPDSGEAFGTLTPDGREFYFTKHHNFARHHIMVTRLVQGQWTRPELVPISGLYNDREPRLSPDGKRLYFSSNRHSSAGDTAQRRDLDLWFSDRQPNGEWSTPRHIEGVNSDANDFSPVVTGNGTLYFVSTRTPAIGGGARPHNVWVARPGDLANGVWAAPENAGAAVNAGFETNVFVTPDDSLMLVSRDGAPEGLGGDDLFFSRRLNGSWQQMRHLPAPINSKEYEYGPAISADGQWLFFTSHRTGNGDIYRVSAGSLDRK